MAWITLRRNRPVVYRRARIGERRITQYLGNHGPMMDLMLRQERQVRAYCRERSRILRSLFQSERNMKILIRFATGLVVKFLGGLGFHQIKRGPWRRIQPSRRPPPSRHAIHHLRTAHPQAAWLHVNSLALTRARHELRLVTRQTTQRLRPLDEYAAFSLLEKLHRLEQRQTDRRLDRAHELLATAGIALKILSAAFMSAEALFNLESDSPQFVLRQGRIRLWGRRRKLIRLAQALRECTKRVLGSSPPRRK